MLIFFTSYSKMELCIIAWKTKIIEGKSLFDRLNHEKRVFVEPKGSGEIEKGRVKAPLCVFVLVGYSSCFLFPVQFWRDTRLLWRRRIVVEPFYWLLCEGN